jgi:hypothetical protein
MKLQSNVYQYNQLLQQEPFLWQATRIKKNITTTMCLKDCWYLLIEKYKDVAFPIQETPIYVSF